MITDRQKALMLQQYSDRGILKKEIRSYEVSLWTLQDSFITVLKWSDVEQKGRIEEPKMTLNIDGTQELTFSIPMYYYFKGQMIENPNWYTTRNGNIMASMRKIKVIFNKATTHEAVFEFLITDVKETHENDISTCELKCEGLAFHELGKIGYMYSLSQDLFELDYEEWQKTGVGEEPVQTMDYWCNKIDLPYFPANPALVNAATWYYKVDMHYSSFSNVGPQRDSNKIYEESYTSAWTADLKPKVTQNYQEKARPISIENSNVYNITQELAEKFNVFCRYDYKYDENYHIKSRCITFYNSYLQEEQGVLTFMYPHSSSSISREMDGTDLTTKLFVSDVDDDTVYNGYHSIMNVEANKTRENYILNFDYLRTIGTITEEQYNSITPYEIKVRALNDQIMQLQSNLAAYQEQVPELEAKVAVLEKSINTANEQITQNKRLKNALDVKDGDADGYISVTQYNPDQKIIITNASGTFIRVDDTNKGIDASSIKIYRSYNSANQTLSNEITGFIPEYEEEYNTLIRIGVPAQTGSQIVYLTYKYNPQLYYDQIITTWETKLGQDNDELDKQKEKLGELDEHTGKGISGLRKVVTDTEDAIKDLLTQKQAEVKAFERIMGPAIREGYWQPEDYNDYGEQMEATETLEMNNPAIIMTDGTGTGMKVGWEMDLFDGEQDIYYKYGITETKTFYPVINLTSIYSQLQGHAEDFSFIFNNNYYDSSANTNDIKNISVYKIGSQALIRFVRQENSIYPALIIVGAKTLSDDQLNFMFDASKGNPRIAKISTSINEGTGVVSTTITDAISVSDDRFWKFNGQAISACNVVYPRVKFSSLALKTDTTNLLLRYNNVLLAQFTDYRVNTRTVERDGNYYPEYFITIKPEVIFANGFNLPVKANYVLSNADTSIYLDALDVSKENAYPKVSYEITPNLLNPNLSHTLYEKLAQVVMINDVDLKFENTFGYISEIELDLDDVTQDSVTIKNYKTKFEDLFSTIVASTESMKHAENALSAAAVGGIALNSEAFSVTLQNNAAILNAFLDSHFDSSQVVLDKLTELFTEAGQILAASSDTLNAMHSLTVDNASILGNFAQDVSAELSTNVYRQSTKPSSFKFGDIWIQTDNSGNEIGRYMATSTGTANSDPTAGFVRTWDGTLAQIYGASLNVDADQGIIDILARNYLNLKAGNVYIAANHRVDIVGNESVNIGGAELNFCSLYEEDVNGTQGQLIPTKGINLIAGTYSQKNNSSISKIIITPVRLEFASSEMLMKAASSITMISSTGTGAGTAAVSINANKGIWIGAGAGVHIYSGTAADRIFIGPKHKAKFQMGDIWVRINKISNAGHDSYDGDPNITDSTKRQYYTTYIQSGNDYSSYFTIEGKYVATQSWDEVYSSEAAANEGMNETNGWTKNNAVLENDDILNEKGASVEMNEEHILFGYSNVQKNTSNSTAVELTDEYVLIAAGDNFQAMQGRSVTGMSNSLIGAKFTKDSIGMAVGSGNDIAAMIMNYNGLTFGHGLGSINIGTASNTSLRSGVQSTGGSYVRISHSGIELGSTAELYINTNNFKLQTYSLDPQNTSYVMGDTILAIGNKLNDITAATTPAQIMNMDGKNDVDVRLVVNSTGLYIKGDVYATNGSFSGDVIARTLYANGGLTAQGTGFVFAVDGNYLGMYRITTANGKISDSTTQKLLYFDSAANILYLTGTLDVANINISESGSSQTWEDYFSNLDISYMDTVDAKIQELFDTAGQVIQASITSANDLTALNQINETRLAGFKTAVVDGLRPDEATGAQHMAKFKKGDVWYRTGSAGAATFMATQNWDEVYDSEALASTATALASTDGWNRISGGAIADIRGANLIVDAEAGSMALKAANTITLQTNTSGAYTTSINLNSNNIEFTASANQTTGQGGTLKLSGETSVSIASGGGIYLVTSNAYDGTKAVSIDKNGIDLASSSNIQLRAGGSINIYSASETTASAFRLNKNEGIWVGSDQKIDFAATANGSGSALRLTKERILLGVTTNSNTGAVDITPEQIILGIANAATGMENMNIALDGSASGVRITREVIQLATGSANRRSLISMEPERIFIGTASQTVVQNASTLDALKADMKTDTAQNKGAYIDISNKASTNYPIFEIGSTAQFTILTPKFMVNNLASGNTLMFYMADNATWGDSVKGIKFSPTGGLDIHATSIRVAADQITFVSAVANGATNLSSAFTNIDDTFTAMTSTGTLAVKSVSTTGFSISGNTFNMTSTGTMWIHGNNGVYITTGNEQHPHSVVIDKNGIALKTGASFSVESTHFEVTTDGKMTCTSGYIGGWKIKSSSLENDISGGNHVELSSDGDYFIWAGANSGSSGKFRVKKNGDTYMNSLMIYDPQHLIGTDAGVYEGDYIRIDFSGLNFSNAISLNAGGSWSGYTFTATITCWGKIKRRLSMTAKVKLLDAEYLGFNASTFRATFKVNVERSVNGSAVAEDLSWDSGIDVTVPVNYGWMKAADAVKYTPKAKSLTVPTGDTFDSTGPFDISATWDDGYANGKVDTIQITNQSGKNVTIKTTSVDGNNTKLVTLAANDVWDDGYKNGKVNTIEITGQSGKNVSIKSTSVDGNNTKLVTLEAADVWKNGWNDCVASMSSAVTDAYKKNGTKQVSYSGTVNGYDSLGNAKTYSYSGTVTVDDYTSYSGLYTKPSTK